LTTGENLDVDFNKVLEEFKSGKKLTGKSGLLAPLIKQLSPFPPITRA